MNRQPQKFLLFMLLFGMCLYVVSSNSVSADDSAGDVITIKGVVVNETLPEIPAEIVPVTLYINGLGDEVESLHTLTGAGGAFEFKSVKYNDEVLYGLTVEYKTVLYSSLIEVAPEVETIVAISVYENTEDSSILSIDSASIVVSEIDIRAGMISILEMASIVNDSKFSYVPGDGPMDLIRFALPHGASNLILDTSLLAADYIQVDKGVALISSVPPGSHEVFYSYAVPYTGSTWSFSKTWRYGAKELRVLVPENLANLQVGLVEEVKQISLAGKNYNVVETSDVGRAEELLFSLSGIEELSYVSRLETDFKSLDFQYVGPVGLSVILIGAASWGIWRTAKVRDRRAGLFLGSTEVQIVKDMLTELESLNEGSLIDQKQYMERKAGLEKRLELLKDD